MSESKSITNQGSPVSSVVKTEHSSTSSSAQQPTYSEDTGSKRDTTKSTSFHIQKSDSSNYVPTNESAVDSGFLGQRSAPAHLTTSTNWSVSDSFPTAEAINRHWSDSLRDAQAIPERNKDSSCSHTQSNFMNNVSEKKRQFQPTILNGGIDMGRREEEEEATLLDFVAGKVVGGKKRRRRRTSASASDADNQCIFADTAGDTPFVKHHVAIKSILSEVCSVYLV